MQPYKRPRLTWTFLTGLVDVEPKAPPLVIARKNEVIVEHRKAGKRTRFTTVTIAKRRGN